MTRSSMVGAVEGGYDTARITASEQDQLAREQRKTDALAYLTRTGNLDIAPALGLVDSPKPKRTPRKRIGGERA